MVAQELDYRKEKQSGSRLLGQLTPEFQNALARRFETVTLKDCDFYHTMVLGDRQVITAEWDLGGDESAYTGHYPFANTVVGRRAGTDQSRAGAPAPSVNEPVRDERARALGPAS